MDDINDWKKNLPPAPKWGGMSKRDYVIQAVERDGMAMRRGEFFEFIDDKEIGQLAVQNRGNALVYLSDRLRDDKDVVLAAVTQDSNAIRHAGLNSRADKDIARQVLYSENMGDVLGFFSDEIRGDYNLIAGSLPNVHSATYAIRNDAALMTEILKKLPSQAENASTELKNDAAFMAFACRNQGAFFNYREIGSRNPLLKDKAFALEMVDGNAAVFPHLPQHFKDDPEVVLHALLTETAYGPMAPDEGILQYASNRIQDMCAGTDPIKVLSALTLSQKLETNLSPKKEIKLSRKL